MTEAVHRPSTVAVWIRAVRVFSFTASLMPGAVAAALAAWCHEPVRWELLPLVILGSVLMHAGTNLVCDEADFRHGVDRKGTLGGSGVLVEGLLTGPQVFRAGVGLFAAAAAIGLVLVWARGLVVLWFGLAGVAGGLLYGCKSFGYKYYALGDPMVFLLMGPLMVLGSYFVLAGRMTFAAGAASIPVGCLVTAILHANNIRDIVHDRQAGSRTVANVIGHRAAKVEYFLLVGVPYAVVAALVILRMFPVWCLAVMLSAPLAAACLSTIARVRPDNVAPIAAADVQTAKLHLLFLLLMCAGLVAGTFL